MSEIEEQGGSGRGGACACVLSVCALCSDSVYVRGLSRLNGIYTICTRHPRNAPQAQRADQRKERREGERETERETETEREWESLRVGVFEREIHPFCRNKPVERKSSC